MLLAESARTPTQSPTISENGQTVKNLLLLTIDCLGADKLWRGGGTRLPSLAALEREGVSFVNTFSTTSSTTPSIASIMTGVYPGHHGIRSTRGWTLNPELKILAEYARDEGCATLAHASGPLNRASGLYRGFQSFEYVEPWRNVRFLRWGVGLSRHRTNTRVLLRSLDDIARRSDPWFHWVHLLDLHNRWRPKPLFSSTSGGYERALDALDVKLSKIMSRVDLDSTLVVVTADHGHFVRELDATNLPQVEYREAHGFHVYDLLTRVPLIIVARGSLPAGRVVTAVTQTIDILPTIQDLMGWSGAEATRGLNLRRVLDGLDSDADRPIYLQACGSILRDPSNYLHAVRRGPWKLVAKMSADDHEEAALFDLRTDQFEQRNVRDSHPQVVSELGGLLLGFRDESN